MDTSKNVLSDKNNLCGKKKQITYLRLTTP